MAAERSCYALIKITWFPDLVATVDGKAAPIVRVTPGFGAIALPAGEHHVEVRYAPGPLKPILFAIGILFVALAASKAAAPRLVTAERRFANAVEGWAKGWQPSARLRHAQPPCCCCSPRARYFAAS